MVLALVSFVDVVLSDCGVHIIGHSWTVEVTLKHFAHSKLSWMPSSGRMKSLVSNRHKLPLVRFELYRFANYGHLHVRYPLVSSKFRIGLSNVTL